jgi:LysR family glycine cleavage system transcriptional activator
MEKDPHTRTVRRIAPLNPLRAFEAAARHLSFTQAADELCVTQGAVSRSVKALEDYMGEPLFERCHNGLLLSEKSDMLAHRLTDIFDRLSAATAEFRGQKSTSILTLRTYTSFMIGFLLPNLANFQMHHPKIKVRLISGTDSVELSRSQEDVRIRYGHGQWRGVESTLLFRDQLRPVCSPKLLDPAKRPYPISVLKDHVLLHQEFRHNDWPDWLARAGGEDITAKSNVTFEELSVAYQAAISGAGIVVAQCPYFLREIAEGQLFEPFDEVLHRDLGYYLTIPHERRDASQVVAFKDWLVRQFRQLDLKENETAPAMKPAQPAVDKLPVKNYKFSESRAA